MRKARDISGNACDMPQQKKTACKTQCVLQAGFFA
jgi:hypothetical protein